MPNLSTLTSLAGYFIPENSAATPGLFNNPMGVLEQNLGQLNADAGALILNASGLSGHVNIGLPPYGANGNGVVNNASAFTTIDSAVTNGWILVPQGTYSIQDSITLSGRYLPVPGALLQPASGKTITVSGHVNAGPWQWADLSKGGAVVIAASNPNIPWVYPQWYGVLGDGTTEDSASFRTMLRMFQAHTRLQLTQGFRMVWGSTVTISALDDFRMVAPTQPRQSDAFGEFASAISWSGDTLHPMLSLDRCKYALVEGLALWPYDNIAISIDSFGGGVYGSQCIVRNFGINNRGSSNSFVGIDISRTAINNQEYHEIADGTIYCCGGVTRHARGYISAGSDIYTGTGGDFGTSLTSGYSGLLTRLGGAGLGGSMLSCSVKSWIDSTHIQLSVSAASSVTDAQTIFGYNTGSGVVIGASSNAKGIRINRMVFQTGQHAVWLKNGSVHCYDNSYTDFEINLRVDNSTEKVSDVLPNTEQSRQHLSYGGVLPLTIDIGRFGTQKVLPNGSYMSFVVGAAQARIMGSGYDDAMPAGSKFNGLAGVNVDLIEDSNRYPPSTTTGELGWWDVPWPNGVYWRAIAGVSGLPGSSGQRYATTYGRYGGSAGTIVTAKFVGELLGNTPTIIALAGQTEALGAGGTLISTVGMLPQETAGNWFSGTTLVALGGVLPTVNLLGHTVPRLSIVGMKALTPSSMTNGTVTEFVFNDIPSMWTDKFTVPHPLATLQSGVSDINRWNSPSYETDGRPTMPAYTFSSESSLGLYRSGAATIAPSMGTFNLASNSVRLSVRTVASADSTNMSVNEIVAVVAGASGATLAIRSNGTIYYFHSSTSTKG